MKKQKFWCKKKFWVEKLRQRDQRDRQERQRRRPRRRRMLWVPIASKYHLRKSKIKWEKIIISGVIPYKPPVAISVKSKTEFESLWLLLLLPLHPVPPPTPPNPRSQGGSMGVGSDVAYQITWLYLNSHQLFQCFSARSQKNLKNRVTSVLMC